MNILAIQSSGNSTSLCVILKDDVLQYSINHGRKDRPNWLEMLAQSHIAVAVALRERSMPKAVHRAASKCGRTMIQLEDERHVQGP